MEDKKIVNRQIGIRMTPRMEEMLQAVMNEMGLPSITATLAYCVAQTHNKLFAAYLKRGAPRGVSDPEGLAKHRAVVKKANKEASEDLATAEQRGICEIDLNGQVVDGNCVYNTYYYDRTDEQTVPLEMLTKDYCKGQFQPSKEEVLKENKIAKKIYGKN